MNLKNQPPIFVPREFCDEIEKLPKAALMDMVWDYAAQFSRGGYDRVDSDSITMTEFRNRREIILTHRHQAKSAGATRSSTPFDKGSGAQKR